MQHFWLGTGLLMAALGRAKNIGQRALTWMYHYNMYFHGVKSTAHPPIIGLLGYSTDSVVKQRSCLHRILITTLGLVSVALLP